MLRKRFSFLLDQSFPGQRFLRHSSMILALAAVLTPTVGAQPKFKILHTVPGGLFSGLTFDAKGNLHGVTGAGGDHNQGTIFELTPGAHGWTLKTLHSFNGQDGGSPNGGLIFDAAGNFYGTALGGPGYGGAGLAYEMVRTPSGWRFTILYDFCLQFHCPDGGFPGPLTMDGAGNLFGLAAGGAYDGGVAFELMPGTSGGSWTESVLYNFDGIKTGFGPSGQLIFDAAGNLYGTTVSGGRVSSSCYFGCGTVFEMSRRSGGWRHRKLWQFDGADGGAPSQGVVFDGSGNLYGTTYAGGRSKACTDDSPCGTIFKLTPEAGGHWKETVLYDFPKAANGSVPSSGVVFDKAGILYGTTAGGGNSSCTGGCGVVYRLTPTAGGKWKYTVLHKFTGQDSAHPDGMVLDSKGNLYGTAYSVVYEITP
jgi:uncharacterized repeat protein (TIGR03803 family)